MDGPTKCPPKHIPIATSRKFINISLERTPTYGFLPAIRPLQFSNPINRSTAAVASYRLVRIYSFLRSGWERTSSYPATVFSACVGAQSKHYAIRRFPHVGEASHIHDNYCDMHTESIDSVNTRVQVVYLCHGFNPS